MKIIETGKEKLYKFNLFDRLKLGYMLSMTAGVTEDYTFKEFMQEAGLIEKEEEKFEEVDGEIIT